VSSGKLHLVLLPECHKPLQPRKILPVKPLLQRFLAGRNNRLRIGTKLAAIKAVSGALPRVVTVDWLIAKSLSAI
jgi:hypothetical protein